MKSTPNHSGSTIAAGLFVGLDREEAARFSFLLSIPAVSAATLKEGLELLTMDATMTATLPAFPNDNSLASSYYARLMTWLVKTKQVGEDAVSKAPVSKYWTNEIAW
mgnify:CR=1 FL=1